MDAVFSSIIDALQKGDKIELRGFGSFRIRRRDSRTGRNPKTGAGVRGARQEGPALQARQGAPGADQPALTGAVGPASLYVKDPRDLPLRRRRLAEAESLLGSPLPRLPPPTWRRAAPSTSSASTRSCAPLLQRFLQGLLRGDRARRPAPAARPPSRARKDQAEYEAALERLLRSVRAIDRRLGLLNLFWLAHTPRRRGVPARAGGEEPGRAQAQVLAAPAALVLLPPRGPGGAARGRAGRPRPARVPGGRRARTRASWTPSSRTASPSPSARSRDLDFNQFLAANKRYRLSADLFFEIYSILVRETERRLREGDRGLLARVAATCRACPRSSSRPRPAS